MFKRRVPRSPLHHISELFWPSMGWGRTVRYIRHRIVRLSDSSRNIAVGLACGVFASLNPLLGTHILQAIFLSYFLRGNLLAAAIGTFVGNPWTFPFMWWGSIEAGSWLFHWLGMVSAHSVPEDIDLRMIWEMVWHEPTRLFLPWLVGSYILAFLIAPLSYYPFYALVRSAKIARHKAKLARIRKEPVHQAVSTHPEPL